MHTHHGSNFSDTDLYDASAVEPSGRKVLVTGGAGFVGSHLCERLWRRGDDVICLDDLSTGSRRNVDHLIDRPRFCFVEHDVCLPFDFDVDSVYNLACPASPVHYQSDATRTYATSVIGTLNLMAMARKRHCVVLQASTSEVYGDPLVHPQTEDYWGHVNPIGIRACYDEGKRGAETIMFDYHRQYGVNIKVARIFNTYGPRMHPHDGRVVSNFIRQALCGEDITIYGEGEQTRSFCYVDDLVEGLILLMDSELGFTGPVNLGNPNECSMIGLAEQVMRLTGSSSRLVHMPLPGDDPKQRCPDITIASLRLGWMPRTSLQKGLVQTERHFRQVLGIPAIADEQCTSGDPFDDQGKSAAA